MQKKQKFISELICIREDDNNYHKMETGLNTSTSESSGRPVRASNRSHGNWWAIRKASPANDFKEISEIFVFASLNVLWNQWRHMKPMKSKNESAL